MTALGQDVSFPDPADSNNITTRWSGRRTCLRGRWRHWCLEADRHAARLSSTSSGCIAPGGAKRKPALGRTISRPRVRMRPGQRSVDRQRRPFRQRERRFGRRGTGDFIVDASDFFETGAYGESRSRSAGSRTVERIPARSACRRGVGTCTRRGHRPADPRRNLNTPYVHDQEPGGSAGRPDHARSTTTGRTSATQSHRSATWASATPTAGPGRVLHERQQHGHPGWASLTSRSRHTEPMTSG